MAPQERTTIAILGPNSIPEHALAHLLQSEGYATKLLKVPPTGAPTALPEGGSVEDLLDGVDVVLLWPSPSLSGAAREAFLCALRRIPATAGIPVLALSPTVEVALQDELAVVVSLGQLFDDLVRSIETILSAEAG